MSSTSTGQSRPKDTATKKKPSKPSKQVILIGKAKGQNWEDFENYCVEVFRKAGLLKDE